MTIKQIMPPIDFIPMPSRSTSFSGATAATYDDADYDVLSVLSDCFSDSSVISSSNFGQLASGASATATGATSTGATATGNLSGSAEARVMNWVQHGFSSRISPDIVMSHPNNQRYKSRTQVRRLATMLARHSYFGERTLALSSVTGKTGRNLDPVKLGTLKAQIRAIFPSLSSPEFEVTWRTCIESLRDLCKRKRQELKQFNLVDVAMRNEGLT